MKWDEVPKGASLAMSREAAMSLRGHRTKNFTTGVICGAALVIVLQSCVANDDNKDEPGVKPSPSVTTPAKPNN